MQKNPQMTQPARHRVLPRRFFSYLAWATLSVAMLAILILAITKLIPPTKPAPASGQIPTKLATLPPTGTPAPSATFTTTTEPSATPSPTLTATMQPVPDILPVEFRLDDPATQPIINAYLARSVGEAHFGGKVFCAYQPLTDPVLNQEGIQAHIYLWAMCQEYYRDMQGLETGTGMSVPVAITLLKADDGFHFDSYKLPRSGSLYAPDVQNLFPASTWESIMGSGPNGTEDYNARAQMLTDQNKTAAEKEFPANPLPSMTPSSGTAESEQRIPSPDGQWTAIYNTSTGGLLLEDATGTVQTIFPQTSLVTSAVWSPVFADTLAVSVSPEPADPSGQRVDEIWIGGVYEGTMHMNRAYTPDDAAEAAKGMGEKITLGAWSPDSQFLLFWQGSNSAFIRADGLPLWLLEAKRGQARQITDAALVNPVYQSWAPDSTGFVFTSGGGRSAQVGKALSKYDLVSQQTTELVSQAQYVPGDVAWSPDGKTIAFAAVEAAKTGPDYADFFGWDNPAIQARRIYLYDVMSGAIRRLSQVEAYQDAPSWRGDKLDFVQIDGDQVVLMQMNPSTGEASPLPGCQASLPSAAGYYGQVDWTGLYDSCQVAGP